MRPHDFYSVAVFDRSDRCTWTKTYQDELEAKASAKNKVEEYGKDYTIELYSFDLHLEQKIEGVGKK